MTKKLIFILFIFFEMFAIAQIPKSDVDADVNVFPKEKVALSINSSVLLAGELLQYKAYSHNASNKKSQLSKVLYVSMRNQNDSVVFSHKLRVANGTSNGDFFIPSNLKTGVYKLIGYTNFSRNNLDEAFVQKNIYIINTFLKNELTNKAQDTVVMAASIENDFSISESEDNSEMLKIILNKHIYGLREKATLQIESNLKNVDGRYALSVRKVDPIEISGNVSKYTQAISSEKFYIPELRGELISGVVLSKVDDNPAANKEVALTIPGDDYIFKVAKTNSNGRFFFSVSEGYDAEKSIVQLYGDEKIRRGFKVVLDNKDFILADNKSYFLKLEPQLKDWLQERSLQLQIENAYFDVKKDSIIKSKINPAFYDNLGTVFLLDDYTRFPSVRETFIEVITLAAVRGTGTNTRFLINNEYDPNGIAKFNDIDPLVLMDGMLIQDNTELINYNVRDIESIRIITKPYRYGSKIYSGIIAVETKKGDFVPNLTNDYATKIDLPPALKKKENYSPNYNNNNLLSRIPDYRVQLLWDPNVKISDGNYSTPFYTSDVTGVYEISIEGFSDTGIYLFTKKYFKVVEN